MGKTLGYGEITVANMTEPFTVMLTNEAQQFATDSNRKVTSAQSYYTDIIVIRGSQERTDYTIGNITSGSGITVSKSSKRVTFSVSAGTTIGADTGVIEIPITLDGQTVKKQFSWSCGKQGPQGVQGKDGTSIKITSKSVTYQTSTSGTTAPTGTWSTTVPTVNNGQYLWTKTTVQYSDGNKTEAYSVSYKGTNGTNGTSVTVSKTEVTYQVSTSGTTAPTGTWSTTMPSCDQGQYLWTKTYVKYSDGKETTSYSVSYKGVDGEKFAFNMLRETNQGSKHWVNIGASGKYSVESITTEDSINAVKLICTEPIASNEWQFCDFSDYEMLKSLKASTTYTLSYDIKANRSGKILHNIKTGGGQKVFFANDIACKVLGNETWEHVSLKMTSGTTLPNLDGQAIYMFGDALSKVGYSIIKNLKLTEGIIDTPWAPHPEDLEGRGVSETVQYYLATSQASGVTSSTSGWSTDITTQKLTADKKYLWNCYQTKYSDGTSEPISTPKVIGVYGDKGQKGDSGEDGQDGAGFHWNLLSGTKDFDKTKMSIAGATSFDSQKYLGLTVIKAVSPTSGYIDPVAWNSTITPTPNTQYTISFYAKASVKTLANSYFYPNCTIKCISNHQTTNTPDGAVSTMLSTEWERYSVTWTTSGSVSGTKSIIPVRLQHGISVDGATVYLCGVKLEQSDKPSPWCTTYEETLAKNLTITPSSQYFKSTDGGKTFAPDTITIKPTIQGEINFGKWQYSIDGGVSFSDVVSGQKGLTISNNVLSISKDSSLYSDAVTMVTFRAVANDSSFYDTCSVAKIYDVSDIGDGRNLWITRDNITLQACEKDKYIYTTTGTSAVCIGADVASVGTNTIALQTGTKYTISFVISSPSEVGNALWYFCTALNSTGVKNYGGYGVKLVTGENIVSQTITVDTSCDAAGLVLYHLPTGCVIKDIQVEKGSSPTGWTPAPEDVQTAILSTKSEISDVSLKVDKNKQAIEQRVEKTTYQQDLNLVKGDISKANEGLNKWRYEIYPKSLFASEYQGKSIIDVFAKNTNLTPSQSVLINDTDLSIAWNYAENYIGYALTFAKFSAAKSVAITFAHDDGAHIYLNGKLIGGNDVYNNKGESLTLGFVKGWNCIEVVVNEGANTEGFKLGTTISALSECQLMNCYYGTPVARQSHITNQLVENTTNIKGISTKVSKVTSVIGDNGENFTSFKNDYSDFKQTMNGFKTTVGQTYVTKDDFNGLEIGGRNLLLYSQTIRAHNNYYDVGLLTDEAETFNGCPVWSVKNQWGRLTWLFKSHVIDRGLVKVGDTLTYSLYAKTNNASGKSIACSYRFKGNAQAYWFKGAAFNIGTSWARYSATFTVTKDMLATDTYMNEIGFEETVSMSGDDKVYYTCPKLERGTKATDYTPAPEDVNGKIVNVETIANQTAKKFEWIVKGGDSSSNFTLTDRVADLVAERINFKGLVTFSGLNTDAKNEIGKVAQSKVDGLEVGGRNLLVQKNITEGYLSTDGKGSFVGSGGGDQTSDWIDVSGNKYITITLYEDFTNTNNSGRYCEYDADKNCINTVVYNPRQKSSIIIELKSNTKYIRVTAIECKTRRYKIEAGNKATDWTPAPEDVSQDATNKASQALTDAKNYSSSAVNWVTNNGSSTTNLNSMVKKWTDGAVSNTTQINGGWIKANTITASKIALADFTNYSQLTRDTAATYGFAVTDDTDGTWFSTQGIRRDQFISETFPCNGGESYLIEYDISTNAKGANNSTDTKNYIGVAIGVYGYTGTVGSNGLPNKATNIWYATRVTGSETAAVTHVKTTITTSTATKQFRIFLQSNGYYFEGTTKIRNLSVRRMYGGTLIVDGSITADKIATDAIKSRNYISSGGTQGSFLNLSDGSFTSPNLSWDANGNLIASNANLSGLINATKGTVGGWNIATNGLYSGIDENAIKIYSATTYDAQTMYQKQKIQDSFILSQKYINHFVSQQVSVGHNIPYWQTRSFIYNDSQIQLAQSDYCINTSSASNYDAQYSLKDGYISATRIYMEQNITQVGGDVINSSFSIGLDSMMGWCSIQSTKGINIYGNSSRALYVQSNDTSKYNALETEGDVVVNGKIHAVSGDNKIQLNSDNNGSIELYGNTPFIDFHSAYSSADYTCRIIANTPEQLLVCGKLRCDSNIISNNDLIANSWVYAGQNAHYTWQNQLDCYFSCGYYNNTNNVYYYAGYHAFYVNNNSGSGMMYINTNGVTSRVGFTKTSDERIKKNFESFDDNIIDAYMNIEPVKYQLKQSSNDNYHFGFKAQHIDKIFSDYGDTYNESFDICTSRPIDPDKAKELYGVDGMVEEYGLRYDELIAPTTYMVQHIYKELEQVKQEKADLETRLQAIEAKLRL